MAHRKIDGRDQRAGVSLSIVPLFMVVGKNFMPADDRSEFHGLRPDAGRNFAGRHH